MAEPKEPLTERELEIVKLVTTGATNKELASKLFVSENTIKAHLKNINIKLEASTRTEVSMIAVRNGWVSVGDGDASENIGASGEELRGENGTENARAWEQGVRSEESGVGGGEKRISPVPVAPNPLPLPPLPLWRKLAMPLVALGIIASAANILPINRAGATLASDEFRSTEQTTSGQDVIGASESSRWFARTSVQTPRARSTAVSSNGRIYLIGGEVNSKVSGEMLIFDPRTNEWSKGKDKPTPVWNASGVAVKNKVYVIGGTTVGNVASDRLEMYDTQSDEWKSLARMPRALTGHVVVEANNRVYVFGGKLSANSLNTEGFVYEIETDRWSRIAGLPTPRSQTAAVVLNNRIYVVGGYDGHREYATCEFFALDTRRWSGCKPMSIPRGSLGLAQVGAQLYAVGGGIRTYIPFNEKYDANLDRWTPFEIPLRRAGAWRNIAVASLQTEFYVIGGDTGSETLSDNYVYEVLTNKTFLPAFQKNDNQR